jgi:pyruvate dehydrogenase E2 component (dihydrolipoamide acetyltransferase)
VGRIELERVKQAPAFRRIAVGTWDHPGDPSIYGMVEIDMSAALKYAAEKSASAGVKVTVTHLVGKAAAEAIKRRPEINGFIRWGRLYQRKSVDIFYQVHLPGAGHDTIAQANVSGVCVREVDRMTAVDVALELKTMSEKLRRGDEPVMGRAMASLNLIPWGFMRWALKLSSFLNYDLNWNVTWLGIPRDAFGSLMVTNVGSLGIESAWGALVPYSRVPILLTLGKIQNKPWVVGDEVVVRPVMTMGITVDHRFVDGSHMAQMAEHFKSCFADPWAHFDRTE